MEMKTKLRALRHFKRKPHIRRLKKITTFEDIGFQLAEERTIMVDVKITTEGIIISPTDQSVYPTYIPHTDIETYVEVLPNNSVDLFLSSPKQPSNFKFSTEEQRTKFTLLLGGILQLV